jgi:ribosomal-protein-alanine N-acetyltransferase
MKEAILTAEERWDMGQDYRFLIMEKDTKKIAGQIGITNVIRGVAQSAFVGYWIGYPYINKGYATEAVEAIFDFAFRKLRLHRLSLWIAVENAASLRVAEKLGLRYEGTAERALNLGGIWQDTKIYAILEEEWKIQTDMNNL